MNKSAIYTFGGANQDLSRSKHSPQFYYEAQHINLLSTDTQATGGASNEKGNSQVISLPTVNINTNGTVTYGGKSLAFTASELLALAPVASSDQVIIGHTTTRDSIILFSTDDNGIDCIWELTGVLSGDFELELRYIRNLGFSTSNPIQALFNYENINIQKVYWVDGLHQIRAINLADPDVINTPQNNLDFVGEVDFTQPVVTGETGGGSHTAGMIQYAYNLFRLNGSQTKLSPISELYPLDKGDLGGGAVNEVVGVTPKVEINNIDLDYEYIRVYAIKYTSLDVTPSVSLIEEREIAGDSSIIVYDDGSIIEEISVEELLFLGSDPIIPQHITSKDNILFPSNIQDNAFEIPDTLDTRAYSFNGSGGTDIRNNEGIGVIKFYSSWDFSLDLKHPAINPNYSTYKYQGDGSTLGGEGKYIKYTIKNTPASLLSINPEDGRFFKDSEIYRLGIVFYNALGQTSSPKWIADFRAPDNNNLLDVYTTLEVELTSNFYTWLNNANNFSSEFDKPVGYKVLRANRTEADKTIVAQGILGGMMINVPVDSKTFAHHTPAERIPLSDNNLKYPSILLRTNEKVTPLQGNLHLRPMQFTNDDPGNDGDGGSNTVNPLTELQYDRGYAFTRSYQYTAMMQMYSPDAVFNNLTLSSNLKLRIKGGLRNNDNRAWLENRAISDTRTVSKYNVENGIHIEDSNATVIKTANGGHDLQLRGLIANNNDNDAENIMAFYQWYRQFTDYVVAGNINEYPIYGKPEIVERGAGRTNYNNDSIYEYTNNLEGISTDGDDDYSNQSGNQPPISGTNSWNSKNITLVLGSSGLDSIQRRTLESIYNGANLIGNYSDAVLVGELVREDSSIYGGNSFEDKKRTNYIAIGEYQDIQTSTVNIESPGDTFVQEYQFLRVAKTDTEVYEFDKVQYTEVVKCKVETTVDLKNRNDQSVFSWDNEFQPRYDDYNAYNNVYSQQPTIIRRIDEDATFQRVKNYDTRIQASKVKVPNESIDSWTDLLVNETMDLDGKFGPISNVVNFRDNLYAFQDEGIAAITVNPRVQVQGNDGVAIELGTGGILYDYNYITDKSGSRNKWSIQPTKRGIYYYDILNKGVGRVPDMTSLLLSDVKGLHTFFNNNHDFDLLSIDNPVVGTGALIGYDNYNNDVFISLLQGDKSFTWRYDEESDMFTDLKTYVPSRYIYKGEKLFYPSTLNNDLWLQYGGEYNSFFGVDQPSYITLMVNPETNLDCVFDNIEYNSELYLNDIDQPDKSLTHIQAYNEYQDSGRIPLIVGRGSNLRRKFRKWRAEIPREGRERIRNPWIFLKLGLDNTSNYKMILHDVIVHYTI